MLLEDYLNLISARKPIHTTAKGAEIVKKGTLIIIYENDIPRLVEMVRVLAETIDQIREHADDCELVENLCNQITEHVDNLIQSDPFLNWEKT